MRWNGNMSNKFDDFLGEQLKDPEIREEYEALQPEYAAIQAMIDARVRSGMQGDISKIERGNANPSLRTLQRLARGMKMTLRLEFVPECSTDTKLQPV